MEAYRAINILKRMKEHLSYGHQVRAFETAIEALEGKNPNNCVKLYHATTPKKAKKYRDTGCIRKPVRGFTTLQAAMAWALKTGRTVIYEVEGGQAYKLPDHHNKYGEAWWIDEDVSCKNIHCVFSAEKDA